MCVDNDSFHVARDVCACAYATSVAMAVSSGMAGPFRWVNVCWLNAALAIVLLSLHELCAANSISGILILCTKHHSN